MTIKDPREDASTTEGSEHDVVDQGQRSLTEDGVELPLTEASEADLLDQARVVLPAGAFDEPTIAADVPQADALDQARSVLFDEDDER